MLLTLKEIPVLVAKELWEAQIFEESIDQCVFEQEKFYIRRATRYIENSIVRTVSSLYQFEKLKEAMVRV